MPVSRLPVRRNARCMRTASAPGRVHTLCYCGASDVPEQQDPLRGSKKAECASMQAHGGLCGNPSGREVSVSSLGSKGGGCGIEGEQHQSGVVGSFST